jgi:hypothetical protein
MSSEYVHPELNAEVESIGGHYVNEEEIRLHYKDREILVVIGCAIVDKSCCGTGGWRFAQVPGYIKAWKYKTSRNGEPITDVDPIEDEKERREIQDMIDLSYPHSQVNFL